MIRYLLALLFPLSVFSQAEKPQNGVKAPDQNSFVLTNVTILVSPDKTIENGTITVRNGKIVSVEKFSLTNPKDLLVIDGNHAVVVPSFIEVNSTLGISQDQKAENKNGPYYWNYAIRSDFDAIDWYKTDEKLIAEYQKMGFGLVLIHRHDGLAQGYAPLIQLGVKNPDQQVYANKVASFYSFRKGSSQQDYPSSLVGSVALLRQAFYDTQWHFEYGKEANYSLDALNQQLKKPAFFTLDDKSDVFRVKMFMREFKRDFTVIGTGQEQFLGNIWDTIKVPLVIPVNFPNAFDMKDPYLAHEIPYSELKIWEMAPKNPAFLMKHKVPFITSSFGHTVAADFWKHIHQALAAGWTISDLLRSLTIAPATLLGVQKETGTIEAEKWANFIVYDQNPFLYQAKVLEVYSKGERKVFQNLPVADIRGTYSLNIDGTKFFLEIAGTASQPEGKVKLIRTVQDSLTLVNKPDTLISNAKISVVNNDISIHFVQQVDAEKQSFSLKGDINPRVFIFEGEGTNNKGKWVKWSAFRSKKFESKDENKQAWTLDTLSVPGIRFPNNAYGFTVLPAQNTIIFEQATIWTNTDEGIIQEGTVIVENGKIKAIYKGSGAYLKPNGAIVINSRGKILTTGIIDEHSHIALTRGVNEGGQAISCEVRMEDAVNADDIDIYRQLAGGVTAAQLLHGSANPIGGQSALIKLKWGHYPQELLIKNAPKFVKFALGENVKQTNWGSGNRFPQTRMGVEQVYIDAFTRALDYHQRQNPYGKHKDKNAVPPATDLELEALYEIVSGERNITCHSYVQSEINMLMHVADSFGFKINTFTHILEGYKLADKMKEHGVGASTFSDWWAYKFEVLDAIPQNAALMTDMGLTVAINSDDAEMGRRLNQEAAKTIKYGGMTEDQAWKMVTLNPAKLLHLDDRMGTIQIGKDADLVLWTNNPLSITAKPLYTVVDGEILFDAQKDFQMQQEIAAEKARIIAKMSEENKKGEPVKPFNRKRHGNFHCNTLGETESFDVNEH
ncbi:amidohydrolase family protein [Fluviicola sp.]|jgi:imidazolonepropionase-like amidohydrolase|uniref:amidohydrolase family protein n=1 Tax=Fluviicola sp. TaxID=1917219 RepID=UPI0028285E93|nr:amidohydrolase family protein [Fluviicola sp.]MDR0803185.1 amidohydrolase family protein [Fluviicola sp.]